MFVQSSCKAIVSLLGLYSLYPKNGTVRKKNLDMIFVENYVYLVSY